MYTCKHHNIISCIANLNKQKCHLFLQKWRIGKQNKSCLRVGTSGRDRIQGKGIGGSIWWKYYVHIYVKVKKKPVEAIL
jgi:hypothetical protein